MLTSTEVTIILVSFGFILLCGWWIVFHYLGDKPDTLVSLFNEGSALKIIAAVFIVLAVSLLALLDIVEGTAVVAILSAIAGYILGEGRLRRSVGRDK